MLLYELHQDPITGEEWIETDLQGKALLVTYLLNKGTAFTSAERYALGLLGKLPAKIETLDEQVVRAYHQYKKYKSDLQKHIYLNNLHDKNEVLFYKLVSVHLVEMIPILYTPSVGQAVKAFSHEFRQPRGLFISYQDQDNMDLILENRTHPELSVIVVTDGERVLGIGDQGVGAIGIPIAKLMLYTICGGINPYHALPIMLDVGTNNPKLLEDPLYLGWRHPRIQGKEYDQFIEKFVRAIQRHFPNTFLHWEDFGKDNARRILERYRDELCTFNDDMQGTSVAAVAAVLTAMDKLQQKLADQRIVIFGAGTAGVGIADRLVDSLKREGVLEDAAIAQIWLIDREGLLVRNMPNLMPFQLPYVREEKLGLSLEAVVKKIKPTILIGCSAVGGAFTEEIVREMALHTSRPVIFPLSNPTEQSEATPADLLKWTAGKALIATGSPFGDVCAQCNNAFSFPGIGLGLIASRAKSLTDSILWTACKTLSSAAPVGIDAPLLPHLSEARSVAIKIAIAVVDKAREEGLARLDSNITSEDAVKKTLWEPYYRTIRPRRLSS
ncbi:MAG TPA: NAD-dependent malic enzyme [Gammaproteobacteria bacterium]|nr:NAD-dependent malic enzyme [Gammaproteobacteria bacterium]